jgi:hypothetical protein
MSIGTDAQTNTTVSPLRQRMIEDMAARKLGRPSASEVIIPKWDNPELGLCGEAA